VARLSKAGYRERRSYSSATKTIEHKGRLEHARGVGAPFSWYIVMKTILCRLLEMPPATIKEGERLMNDATAQSFKQHQEGNRSRDPVGKLRTSDYLTSIGVPPIPPSTSPFDPGYDPVMVESHLQQSSHLMSTLKISMTCWLIADETATRRKIAKANKYGVSTVTGGGAFEIAVAQGQLPAYLDLCADIGVSRIECGEGFTDLPIPAEDVVWLARDRGLEVQFELGKKHTGAFTSDVVGELIEQGQRWLDAGATQLVIEARESARGVGLFDEAGKLNFAFADRFVDEFSLRMVMFEAPTKANQFALLDHFGREVILANVRLEELLRVEIYRRGLHSDAFSKGNLRPRLPDASGS
jgi:phosphosulfolactate synthase